VLSLNSRAIVDKIGELYTLARVLNVKAPADALVLDDLDGELGRVDQVASISKLDDGWEMVTLKSYLPTLRSKLGRMYTGFDFESNYDPFQPPTDDVMCLGFDRARILNTKRVLERAKRMIEGAWPLAAAFYTYVLEREKRTRLRSSLISRL
jgi:hypothetical protein